jgi:hypothetical protein
VLLPAQGVDALTLGTNGNRREFTQKMLHDSKKIYLNEQSEED